MMAVGNGAVLLPLRRRSAPLATALRQLPFSHPLVPGANLGKLATMASGGALMVFSSWTATGTTFAPQAVYVSFSPWKRARRETSRKCGRVIFAPGASPGPMGLTAHSIPPQLKARALVGTRSSRRARASSSAASFWAGRSVAASARLLPAFVRPSAKGR